MTRLKVALIGLGRMGRVHAEALAKSATVEVVAVADPSPQSREFAKTIFSSAAMFDNYEQALVHDRVEACVIASPTPLHPQMVRDALAHGLHVLCEKPLALELATINWPFTSKLPTPVEMLTAFAPPPYQALVY